MDLILSTSRGKGIGPLVRKTHKNANIIVRPGHKYSSLAQEGRRIITTTRYDPSDIHVYFLAGFPDLTTVERKGNYQEVTFWETPQTASQRVLGEIENAADMIKNTEAQVCFATIIPGNIDSWDTIRLTPKKTNTLKFRNHYHSWQENLNETVIKCNQSIVEINIQNNMQTPRTHQTVVSIRKKGKYRFQFNKLAKDGVHATPRTNELVSRELSKAITKNRKCNDPDTVKQEKLEDATDTESEPGSPKRAWKSY